MDRIFKYFNKVANDNIGQEEWVIGFNIFMKGSEDEMTRFCFDIYDLNDDGYISKEEMLLLMKDCMYKHVKESNDDEGDDGVKVNFMFLIRHFYSFLGLNWNDIEKNGPG